MNLGHEGPSLPKIVYFDLRDDFRVYLSRYSPEVALKIESYLNRFLSDKTISSPLDVAQLFKGLSPGQVHNLDMGLRAFLNFCVLKGYPEDWIKLLKKAIPRDPEFIDLNVPSEEEVVSCLSRLNIMPVENRAVWLLCLEGGLRLTEALRVVSNFDERRLFRVNCFYRYELAYFRGSKQAYYAYFTETSLSLIKNVMGKAVKRVNASKFYERNSFVRPKYLRKFAFDKMIELGVPDSIADFIEGRAPRRIGARHYMSLVKQADNYYGRYAEYLRVLREKCGDLRIS
ncbi:MAG: integrase [Candidatus Bathyarchaeia archaeon]